MRSGKETPANANTAGAKSSLAADLDSMRTAGFKFVHVLRRKDGGVLDAEDRAVIRQQTADANRRVAADDGKAVIVGTNFQIPSTNMAAINDRFSVEDFSPPPDANTAGNANK